MAATQTLLRFAAFELNVTTEELRKNGLPIKLSPQPFRILALLAGRSGQIVSREEIRQQVWGEETYVDFEHGMNQCIKQIRTALSDSTEKPVYIETIPRKGYRFLAPVTSKTIAAPLAVVESTSGLHNVPSPLAKVASVALPSPPVNMPAVSVIPTHHAAGAASAAAATPAPVVVADPAVTTALVPAPAVTPAPATEPAQTPQTRSVARRLRLAAVGAVFIVLVGGFLYYHSRTASALTEKQVFVMADFQNTTGDQVFDDVLKSGLSIQLEQSQFLAALSERKIAAMLKMMNRPANQPLTKEVADEVCQRSGSKLVLDGSVAPIGDHYLITLRATNCQTGEHIGSAEGEAENRNEVVKVLGQVGNQLRKKLGESLPEIEKYNTPLESATTSSLEALQAFSKGREVRAQGGVAIPYFQRALELDPNFARAYASLGAVYKNVGDNKAAVENFQKAYDLRYRVSPRERLQIEAYYYMFVAGDLDAAMQTYLQWMRTYPDDPAPHANLGVLYTQLGQYDKAVIEMQERARLSSGHPDYNLVIVYACMNRLNDAQALLDQAKGEGDSAFLRQLRYSVAFLRGDTATMQQQLANAMGKSSLEDQLLSYQSDTDAYYGRLASGRQMSERAASSARRANSLETAAAYKANEALREAEIGNYPMARQRAAEALELGNDREVEVKAVLALARAGDSGRAQGLADTLDRAYPRDTLVQNYWLPTIWAALELGKGNAGGAVDALKTATPYELGSSSTSGGVAAPGSLYPLYLRGEAYLKAGQAPQAAAEFQKMLDHRGVVGNFILGALAQLQLARAQATAGDEQDARKSYERFLALWKDADSDLSILQQAKAEYAKLRIEAEK